MNRAHTKDERFTNGKRQPPASILKDYLAQAHMAIDEALQNMTEAQNYTVDSIKQQDQLNRASIKITDRLAAMLIDLRVMIEYVDAKPFPLMREDGNVRETTYEELFRITQKRIFKEENFDADVNRLISSLGNGTTRKGSGANQSIHDNSSGQ